MLSALWCLDEVANAVQLAESEAEHAGMRGAAVAAMRHLTAQQHSLRKNLDRLAPVLAAGDPSGSPEADTRLRLKVPPRILSPTHVRTPEPGVLVLSISL